MNRFTRIVANLVILSLTPILFAQMTVSGTVTDASNGEALAGANVVVDGTDLGAAANANGGYISLNNESQFWASLEQTNNHINIKIEEI